MPYPGLIRNLEKEIYSVKTVGYGLVVVMRAVKGGGVTDSYLIQVNKLIRYFADQLSNLEKLAMTIDHLDRQTVNSPAEKRGGWSLLWLSLVVVFAQFLLVDLAQAQTLQQEPQQEQNQPQAVTAEERARALEISRELTTRQQAIEEMRGELGIYSPALQEAYSDLAAFYTEIEDYDNAIRLYSDALQVARINTGLYSSQQLPLIQDLIGNNDSLKQWQEVDDLQQLSYHISSRLFELGDPAYIGAAEQYGSWKLRLLRENLLDFNYRDYSNTATDLSRFYESVIDKLEAQTDSRPSNLLALLYAKTEIDLTLARSVASTPYTAFEGTASRYVTQSRCRNVRGPNGQTVRQCVNVQVENPRYRQSQRDAKRFELNRHSRSMRRSIEKLRLIKDSSSDMSISEKQALEVQITQLEVEFDQLVRLSRRGSLL